MKYFTTKIAFGFLLLAMISPGFAMADSQTAVGQVSQQYIIKLKQNKVQVLAPYASAIEQHFPNSRLAQFQNIYSFSSSLGLVALRQDLAGQYDYLELDQVMQAKADASLVAVNDPGFTSNPFNIDLQWGLAKAQFPQAWTKAEGSARTVVAIIDTGVDETHEDLSRGSFLTGFDFNTRTAIPPGTNSDDNGHGTLVAGVIGATPNNGLGIAGTNWHVGIMPLKALDSSGSGSSSDVSEAIVWAADRGANIINLSLGGLGFSHDTTLSNAITYAYRKNVLIVAAAGNDVAVTGGNLDINPVFPVCDDNGENMVMGVAASDADDYKPDFSNFGHACIDVTAPGKRILSAINHDPVTRQPVPNAYAYASGTSLSVPFVVGEAALLKSFFPDATVQQLRDQIIATAEPIAQINTTQCGGGSCKGLLGAGRINALKSLQQDITPVQRVVEGDLVSTDSQVIYYITGGKRRPVSAFVRQQRFANAAVKSVTPADLTPFPEGPYMEPLDKTLVMTGGSQTVYYMSKGLKLPVTYQIFQAYHFQFSQVNILSAAEVNSWITGSFLTPPEGTLVKTSRNQTVYWVVGGALHAVNYNFFIQRGLNIFPIMIISDSDRKGFSKGEAYIS